MVLQVVLSIKVVPEKSDVLVGDHLFLPARQARVARPAALDTFFSTTFRPTLADRRTGGLVEWTGGVADLGLSCCLELHCSGKGQVGKEGGGGVHSNSGVCSAGTLAAR